MMAMACSNNRNGGDNAPSVDINNFRQAHLTTFASLFNAARADGCDEAVVGIHHDVEMAACFSQSHLRAQQQQQQQNMNHPITPQIIAVPSISSSSLSMHSKGCSNGTGAHKHSLMENASMNMAYPFYTTPDTITSTAKTQLQNVVTTMEELIDSRLRASVSQIAQKQGGGGIRCLKLLSPSRNPIQIATVITRFVLPSEDNNDNGENMGGSTDQFGTITSTDDTLSIPLRFKAITDINIFGELVTIEISSSVTMTGKFDTQSDGLFSAVDIVFDCSQLLQNMISQARIIVKMAVTKAATLSVQISKWYAKRNNNGNNPKKVASSQSIMGGFVLGSINSSILHDSMHSFDCSKSDVGSISSIKTSASVLPVNKRKSLLRNPLPSKSNLLNIPTRLNNANAIFGSIGTLPRTSSMNTVRFQEPAQASRSNPQAGSEGGGNIHSGLFSWLQDESMFLTESKMKQQDKEREEAEKKRREAPMPLRFFTAAKDLGGGEGNLQAVSQSIFGAGMGEHQQHFEDDGGHLEKRQRLV